MRKYSKKTIEEAINHWQNLLEDNYGRRDEKEDLIPDFLLWNVENELRSLQDIVSGSSIDELRINLPKIKKLLQDFQNFSHDVEEYSVPDDQFEIPDDGNEDLPF